MENKQLKLEVSDCVDLLRSLNPSLKMAQISADVIVNHINDIQSKLDNAIKELKTLKEPEMPTE